MTPQRKSIPLTPRQHYVYDELIGLDWSHASALDAARRFAKHGDNPTNERIADVMVSIVQGAAFEDHCDNCGNAIESRPKVCICGQLNV